MCTCSIIDDSCADEEQNIAYTQLVLIFSMRRAHEYASKMRARKMPAYATQGTGVRGRAGKREQKDSADQPTIKKTKKSSMHAGKKGIKKAPTGANMVGDEGFEPPTLCV